jgi:hypothetical protein
VENNTVRPISKLVSGRDAVMVCEWQGCGDGGVSGRDAVMVV